MKKTTRWLLTLVMVLAASGFAQVASAAYAPASESNDRILIRLNYWTANYTGKVDIEDIDILGGTATIKGQELDLVDELGLDNPQNIPELEILIRLGQRNRIILSYFTSYYGGDKALNSDVDFAGYTFAVGTRLKTTFGIDRFKLFDEILLITNERGNLGITFGMEYYLWRLGYEGRVTGTGVRREDEVMQPIIIPQAGIEGNLNIAYGFGIYGALSGIGVAYQDISASYTDLDVGLYWKYKLLYTGIAYRQIATRFDAKLDDDNRIKFNIDHSGWLFSIGVNF